ncbi:MAG: hydrogenase expression/formation protein HypE [Planctomycetota bacterium]|nr:hydrogenase expression/formation protein HypE [Planctomycetota bacterium]
MDTEHIQLAHGGGGQLTAELIEHVILPALSGVEAEASDVQQAGRLTDAASLDLAGGSVAFTTDSYVVKPLEFPGGNIGKLAVCGTINDLAVAGAVPKALSFALVLQEGLEMELLRRVLASAGRAAEKAGATVVTGDTKVVERDALDGIVINTAGVGEILPQAKLGFDRIADGDRIVLSGPLGEHGMAVMSMRQGLNFSAELESDCAAIHGLSCSLIERLGSAVKFMRDPTRGGLAATLVELSVGTGRDIEIVESAIPVNRTALAAAEMLGLDLLTVANEGKLVAVIDAEAADEAVAILANQEIASRAAVVGTVGQVRQPDAPALVEMVTRVGGRRVVQMPYGQQLPRIC